MSTTIIRFDPRTKIVLLLAANVMLFLTHSLAYGYVLVLFCCMILAASGQWKSSVKFLALYLCLCLMDQFVIMRISGYAYTLSSFIVVLMKGFMPCIILGKWILSTTEVGEIIAAMWRMRMPQSAIIPLSVVFRYFPTVRDEWKSIRNAMKMRGIGFSVEHIMTPMLLSAITISEELSAAALCRALDAPGWHTSMRPIGFHLQDILALVIVLMLLIAGFWLGVTGR